MPCRDWRPVVAVMGARGWELAAMVQTPSLVQSSFTKYTMKILMIFQRNLNSNFEKLKQLHRDSTPPPNYSNKSKSRFGKAQLSESSMFGSMSMVPENQDYKNMLDNSHDLSESLSSGNVVSDMTVCNGYARSSTSHDPPPYWDVFSNNGHRS